MKDRFSTVRFGETFKRLAAEWKGRPVPNAPRLSLPALPEVLTVGREQANENTWCWLKEVQAQL